MRIFALLIALTVLPSCINKNAVPEFFPMASLNSNSAKVWIIHSSSQKDDKMIAALDNYKTCFVFYNDNYFMQQELIHLGTSNGIVGQYSTIIEPDEELFLKLHHSNKNSVKYKIEVLTDTELHLRNETTNVLWKLKTLTLPI